MSPEEPHLRSEAGAVAEDFRASLAFLTRIPADRIGAAPGAPDFHRAARVFPLAGVVVGAIGEFVLWIATLLGVPPFVAAALAVAAAMIVTGGLHEDGLADTADGFGGGATAARKLEIMADSRIGTFGAAALVLSILIRVAALASLAAIGGFRAALVLIAAEAVSRAAMVRLWQVLPPARLSGLAHDAGPPDDPAVAVALTTGAAIALVLVWPAFGFWPAIAGILLAAAASYIFMRVADREIGGRTGDTLGACQQIALAAFLVGVAA